MIISFLNSWQTEKIIFLSELKIQELVETLNKHQNKNKTKSFLDKVFDKNGLDIIVKSNLEIEIQPIWQFLQIPGGSMTAKMKGKIVADDDKTKIVAQIQINSSLKFLVILFVLMMAISLFTTTNILIDFVIIIIAECILILLLLLYLNFYKMNLINNFITYFNLKVE